MKPKSRHVREQEEKGCIESASQWIQCERLGDDGSCPGFPEESVLACVLVIRGGSGSITITTHDSNLCRRCPDKTNAPESRINIVSWEFGCRIYKGTTRSTAGAQRKFRIDD